MIDSRLKEFSFPETIAVHAANRPSDPAIVQPSQPVITYQDLARLCGTVKARLHAEALRGCRVGTMLGGARAAIMQIAVPSAAVCVPLDARLGAAELMRVIRLFELDALVVDLDVVDIASEAAESAGIALFSCRLLDSPWRMELEGLAGRIRRRRTTRNDGVAFLMRSSGTTGAPKLIPLTHHNVLAQSVAFAEFFDLTAADRAAALLPLHYAAGLGHTLLSPLMAGGSLALPDPDGGRTFLEWLAAAKPTWLTTSPATLRHLLDSLGGETDLGAFGIKFILSGGSLVPDGLSAQAERLLKTPILATYGLTEVGVVAAQRPGPVPRRPGTVGRPTPAVLTVRTGEGEEAAVGTEGMICLRGEPVTPGYLGSPPIGDNWLETGDVGFIDELGELHITGRVKELINRGGEKISPYEVEAAALEHPDVAEAVAFSAPHPRLGEDVGLAVILRGDANVTPATLQDFIGERLLPFKTPRRIHVLSAIPPGPTGKVDRQAVAKACAVVRQRVTPPTEVLEYELVALWSELLGTDEFGVEDDFFVLGGDSLLAEQMLTAAEEMTRTRIALSDLKGALTIRSLFRAISAGGSLDQPLIERVRDGEGAPFYYCHGDVLTRGFYAIRLAERMALTRPVHVINTAYHLPGGSSMRAVAALCVQQMVQEQPEGPFDLGGLCNGGLLAWEIASQLIGAGRTVNRVVLVDALSLNTRLPYRLAATLTRNLPRIVPLNSGRSTAMAALWLIVLNRWTPSAIVRRFLRKGQERSPADAPSPAPSGLWSGERNNLMQAMADYVPPALPLQVHCLIAAASTYLPEFDPARWRSLARTCSISVVPGDHMTCVSSHAPYLAQAIRACLETPPAPPAR